MHDTTGPAPQPAEPGDSPYGPPTDPESVPRTKEWIFFPGGDDGKNSPVIKEIRKEKLSAAEATRLADLMDRVLAGETMPKDVKNLGDGVMEFKLHLDHRSYRMAYAEVKDGFVLLGLTFFRKTQQRQPKDVSRAKERLKSYLRDAEHGE